MKSQSILLTTVIFTALLMSGCLGIKPLAVSHPESPAIFVDYQKSGGIAGLDNRLVIFTNGAGLISGKNVNRELSFNQSELRHLDELFSRAGFSELEPSYTSRHGGADLIRYSISFRNMTVTTEDTAIPPSLQPVIDELNGIMDRNLAPQKSISVIGNLTG